MQKTNEDVGRLTMKVNEIYNVCKNMCGLLNTVEQKIELIGGLGLEIPKDSCDEPIPPTRVSEFARLVMIHDILTISYKQLEQINEKLYDLVR